MHHRTKGRANQYLPIFPTARAGPALGSSRFGVGAGWSIDIYTLIIIIIIIIYSLTARVPRSWKLRTQKLKSHLVRTQSLNFLPLKPGVGQYIAIHATLTARDFFLAYFNPSGPFTCIFFLNLSRFLLCWLWLTHGSCVGLQNKIGHPARGRFPY